MIPADAARLLELPLDASPEQLELRYLELRRKLEDKIAKAPTPGLQAKYRESLAAITTAFETLTLAADSSALPLLNKLPATPAVPVPPSSAARPSPAAKKSGGREFIFVALVAVLLLGAGGWFVLKTRAEAAAAREAASLKAEQELAAAKKAEALGAELQSQLAEARTAWEGLERELAPAAARLSDLKSDARASDRHADREAAETFARLKLQQDYVAWLEPFLARHPIRSQLARANALLSSRALAEAQTTIQALQTALTAADEEVSTRKQLLDATMNEVNVDTEPRGLAWSIETRYDGKRVLKTTGVSKVSTSLFVGFGPATTRVSRPGWPDLVEQIVIEPNQSVDIGGEFPGGAVSIESMPAYLDFELAVTGGGKLTGKTPQTLSDLPPGAATLTLRRPGFSAVTRTIEIKAGETATAGATVAAQPLTVNVAEPATDIFVDGKYAGQGRAGLTDLTPGDHLVQIQLKGYPAYRKNLTLTQSSAPATLNLSFAALAEKNIKCSTCDGSGHVTEYEDCANCDGTGKLTCSECNGAGKFYVTEDHGSGYTSQQSRTCQTCRGRGKVNCDHCSGRGRLGHQADCPKCSGDGYLSQLQL